MKKTAKIFSFVLAGAMAAAVTGCGSGTNETTAAAADTSKEAEGGKEVYQVGICQLV